MITLNDIAGKAIVNEEYAPYIALDKTSRPNLVCPKRCSGLGGSQEPIKTPFATSFVYGAIHAP